jgi:ABC-type enterochelin transport system permease subunit
MLTNDYGFKVLLFILNKKKIVPIEPLGRVSLNVITMVSYYIILGFYRFSQERDLLLSLLLCYFFHYLFKTIFSKTISYLQQTKTFSYFKCRIHIENKC